MPIVHVTKDEHRQLQNVANILASSKKVVVVTGAGISTSCGIPDFRSERGLYSLIQSQFREASPKSHFKKDQSYASTASSVGRPLPKNVKGKDLFDSIIWKDPTSTAVFYTFVASLRKKIREEIKQATPTHRLIRTFRDSRKLVRCYTQNIDGLETREGLCMDVARGKGSRARFTKKAQERPFQLRNNVQGSDLDGGCEVVPLHGDLEMLRCTLCQKTCRWEEHHGEASLLKGVAPECFSCATSNQQRRYRGKRGTKVGTLRPNIVLYGEAHPMAEEVGKITTSDLASAPDVLLILGTSLHVHGVKNLVREFAKCVHARPRNKGKVIFVNLSRPSESLWKDSIDYWISMDCDQWVGALRRHRPDLWQIQTELKANVKKKVKASMVPVPEKTEAEKKRSSTLLTRTSLTAADEDEKENAFSSSRKALPVPIPTEPRMATWRKSSLQDATRRIIGTNAFPARRVASLPEYKKPVVEPQLSVPPSSGFRRKFQELCSQVLHGFQEARDYNGPGYQSCGQQEYALKRRYESASLEQERSPLKRKKTIHIWEE